MEPASAEHTLELLGWVLLHFLWQGALLGALFWCANFILRHRSANGRYVAGCATLLMMAAAPAVTLSILLATADRDSSGLLLSSEQVEQFLATPFLSGGAADLGVAVRPNATNGPLSAVFAWKHYVDQFLPFLSIAWLLGVGLMALRQVGGWVWLTYTVRSATLPLRDERLAALAERLVRRPVRFLESSMVQGPATLGVLRPIILLPLTATTGLTHKQLIAIMAHELAHIRRWDYVVNVIQAAIEALLFFHPAVWWVSRRVRQERENCCDDIAADVVGDRTFYAVALERLDRLRTGPTPTAQLALGAAGGELLVRIGRLLGVRPYDLAHVGRGTGVLWAMGCGVVLLLAVELLAASNGNRIASPRPLVSISSSVYAALGLPRDGDRGDPLAAIAAVLPTEKGDDVALRAFAEGLTAGGDPDALGRAIFERVTIDSAMAYQRSPDWNYGSFAQRFALLNRLLDRARDASATVEDRALFARAALALAAQQAPMFGMATLRTMLDAPRITQTAGLSEASLTAVRAGVAEHEARSKAFAPFLVRAKQALAGKSSDSTRQTVAEINDSLRAMAPLTRDRADLQWHLAGVAWQYQSRTGRAADALIADVSAAVESAHFDRWMAQSATLPPPKPRAVKSITHAELSKFRNVTRELRDKLAKEQ
jgi:Zn-dependent protease with chaperone function